MYAIMLYLNKCRQKGRIEMIKSPINESNNAAMQMSFSMLERTLDADVFVYFGELFDGIEADVKK